MAEAKHAFVDDNPYIVYSPKAEMTYDGNSGGGSGFHVIEMDANTGALSATAGELAEMLAISPVILASSTKQGDNLVHTWLMFLTFTITSGKYSFSASILTPGQGVSVSAWEANTKDDYPIPSAP